MAWKQTYGYSDRRFRYKLKDLVQRAGRELVEKALCLYYVAKEGDAPAWAKATALGALGYLINPLDLLPDMVPAAGYTDDLSVLAAAMATLALYITPKIKEKATLKLQEWFSQRLRGTASG